MHFGIIKYKTGEAESDGIIASPGKYKLRERLLN
jgi:hypothetical protein